MRPRGEGDSVEVEIGWIRTLLQPLRRKVRPRRKVKCSRDEHERRKAFHMVFCTVGNVNSTMSVIAFACAPSCLNRVRHRLQSRYVSVHVTTQGGQRDRRMYWGLLSK